MTGMNQISDWEEVPQFDGEAAEAAYWANTGVAPRLMELALALSGAMGARPLPATGVAAGLSALLWLVFGMVLRVPLPRGLIEGLMSWT